jgi:hypothetical protein
VIATAVGLCAIAVAVISGLAVENPAHVVLGRAIAALAVCHILGQVIGASAENVVRRRIEGYKGAHPTPDVMDALSRNGREREDAQAA